MKQSLNAAACGAMLALAGCAYYVAPDGTVVPAGYYRWSLRRPATTARSPPRLRR